MEGAADSFSLPLWEDGDFSCSWRWDPLRQEPLLHISPVRWLSEDEELKEALRQELRLLSPHPHPALLSRRELTQPPGLSLAYRLAWPVDLRHHQAWPVQRAVSAVVDLAEAMDHLAQHHPKPSPFVFKQLGASNLWITPSGRALLCPLRLHAMAMARPVLGAGVRRLHIDWLSPEAIQGLPLSPANDVYELGVILFLMLTGQHPMEAVQDGQSDLQKLFGLLHGAPRLEMLRQSAVPEGIVACIACALQPEPGQRFREPADLACALREHVSAPPGAASTPRDLLERLREGFYHDPAAAIEQVDSARTLLAEPVVQGYVWEHATRLLMEQVRHPDSVLAWPMLHLLLLCRPSPQQSAALWGRLSPGDPWRGTVRWLREPWREPPGEVTAASQAFHQRRHAGASPLSLGALGIKACQMRWEELEPRGERTRHCTRCRQDVILVDSTAELVPLQGRACVHWRPRDPQEAPPRAPDVPEEAPPPQEPAPRASLRRRISAWWESLRGEGGGDP